MNTDILERYLIEVVTKGEAEKALSGSPTGYIGFEPSGVPHLGTGVFLPTKINDLVSIGIEMEVLLADWHAMVNDKLNGDLELIRKSGELLRDTMLAMGLDHKVKFTWAEDLSSEPGYWKLLLKMAKNTSLTRIRRALPIMGRTEEDSGSDFSKLIYPMMQVTDIAYREYDFALGGMDQRHAHMLSRDISSKKGLKKVVALHAPLISSLKGGGRMDPVSGEMDKMSKSDPNTGIFITDTPEEIRRKISGALCTPGEIEGNPVMDIAKWVIFPRMRGDIIVNRPEKKGGDLVLQNSTEFVERYSKGEIHPLDLKQFVSEKLTDILKPALKVAEENKHIIDEIQRARTVKN
ncbi:MAG: tyrosine--tRNA ligase [Candidatus Thermoplasmatota archaeon]|nr:tyrosine--tRNA ligase [Candidatus Thermoplasmatota archaeon]MCL5437782.1 tyrosine--tRNA ligase [Candidatus Thermoplasmatota archaeon]